MELKKDCRYALVVPTSIGLRITPEGGQPVEAADRFLLQATSAETNVASVPAYLGLPVKVLTALVKGSPMARLIRSNLLGRGLELEAVEVEQGGPWGYRHQFNIADSGAGARGPRVHNDRAGEVGRTMKATDFDLDRLFKRDGVQMVHLSGLIAALSPETGELCLAIARRARQAGTRISFDLNHRASMWAGREVELGRTFAELAGLADVLVGNEEDYQLCLGIQGPPPGGRDLAARMEGFKEMIGRVRREYPGAGLFATTLREVIDANHHLWGTLMLAGEEWHQVEPRPITVLDRIGGGDGFVGGLLHGVLRGWPAEKWIRFGWAAGALATTMLTDYGQPADEEQVWNIWQGNARVQR